MIEFPMKFGAFLSRKTLTTGKTRTPPSSATALSSSSSLFKSACLHDWWLIKPPAGEEGLAVAGFSSREGKTVRAFRSAAISKRIDATTLETVDGFTISLVGFINKDLTQQNGFSSEVCSHFQFGFSYDWKEYSVKGSNGVWCAHISDSTKPTFKTCSSSRKNYRRPEDQPLTRDLDCPMSSHQESEHDILTMKTMDDLFESARDLERDESLLSSKDNSVKMCEEVTMAPDRTPLTESYTCLLQEGCGLAKTISDGIDTLENSFQCESGSRKPSFIDRHPESDLNVITTKRKFGETKVAESSFRQGRISSDSKTRAMSVESPLTVEVGGTSRKIKNKQGQSRRITRSMTKDRSNHPRKKKSTSGNQMGSRQGLLF